MAGLVPSSSIVRSNFDSFSLSCRIEIRMNLGLKFEIFDLLAAEAHRK